MRDQACRGRHPRLQRARIDRGVALRRCLGDRSFQFLDHGDALGQQLQVDRGLAGQHLQGAEAFEDQVAPAVFAAQGFQVVQRVVGLVEVGDDQ